MQKLLGIFAVALGAAVFSSQADAFCGDSAASCSSSFNSGSNSPQDGPAHWENFSGQAGNPSSAPAMKFGNFSLYGGVSQGFDRNNPQARYGLTHGADLNSQDQSSGANCALYGTCR